MLLWGNLVLFVLYAVGCGTVVNVNSIRFDKLSVLLFPLSAIVGMSLAPRLEEMGEILYIFPPLGAIATSLAGLVCAYGRGRPANREARGFAVIFPTQRPAEDVVTSFNRTKDD